MLTDSIFTTIFVNLDVNYRQFKVDFVFALMKCSYAAFGEQNKIDNDSKCQQVYKSLFLYSGVGNRESVNLGLIK